MVSGVTTKQYGRFNLSLMLFVLSSKKGSNSHKNAVHFTIVYYSACSIIRPHGTGKSFDNMEVRGSTDRSENVYLAARVIF